MNDSPIRVVALSCVLTTVGVLACYTILALLDASLPQPVGYVVGGSIALVSIIIAERKSE